MSNLFTHTPFNSNTHNQVNLLADEVATAFNLVEEYLIKDNNPNAAISTSIGSLDTSYLKPYHTDNGLVQNYTQSLYFFEDSKEASLDLVPSKTLADLNNTTIQNIANPSTVYEYKHDGLLIADTDFTFVNKKVVFKIRPQDQLTISYTGYPVVSELVSDYNLRYNMLKFGETTEFSVTRLGSSMNFEISGYNFKSLCSPFIQNLIEDLEDVSPYVSIFNTTGSTFTKLVITYVEFTTSKLSFTLAAGQDVPTTASIYVANTSLGDLVKALYLKMYNHNHSSDDTQNVNHKDLVGLFNNTDNIQYITSNKENYDHPQYLNREGYISDPTVYNNSFLGDLLLSSVDDSNFYNNLSDNSNKLIFGSYANGIKLYFDKDLNGLVLDAAEDKNGLLLKAGFNKTILKLNNHLITDRKLLDDSTHLELMLEESEDSGIGVLKLVKKVVNPLTQTITTSDAAKLFVRFAEIGKVVVKEELNISNSNSKISFGTPILYEVKLNATTSSLDVLGIGENLVNHAVDFKVTTKHSKIISDKIYSPNIVLDSSSKITFGDNLSESISYIGQHLTYNTEKYVNFLNNGYRTGLSFDNRYFIYTSTFDGTSVSPSSPNSTNLYFETPLNGEVHFIKNISSSFTEGFTNLVEAPKADIFSNKSYVNELMIESTPSSITGISLDLVDNNKIFANKNKSGNLATIIKTNGTVVIANSYTPSTIGNAIINYGEIEVGKITTNGDSSTEAGFYGNVFIPVNNKLVINGESIFNSNITFSNKVNVTNELIAEKVTVSELVVKNAEVTGNLVVETIDADAKGKSRLGDLEVRESLEVSKAIIQNSSTANNVFNGQLRVVGKTELLSGLDMSSSLITNLINSTSPSADEAVTYGLLKFEQSSLEDALKSSIDLKINQAVTNILERAYPLGTLYFNGNVITNPADASLLGIGIWVRALVGRSPMGYSEDGINVPTWVTNFNYEYGEYDHVLTKQEMPNHQHRYITDDQSGAIFTGRTTGRDFSQKDAGGPAREAFTTPEFPEEIGNNMPHNTVHPVEVIAIWKRIQ